jgi:hypothetical protein
MSDYTWLHLLRTSYSYSSFFILAELVHVLSRGCPCHRFIFGGGICSGAALWSSSSYTTSGLGVIFAISPYLGCRYAQKTDLP